MDNKTNETNLSEKIASFDKTYSTDHIRMLKIILYYIQSPFRKNLAVYIKYLELQHTLVLLRNSFRNIADISSASEESFDGSPRSSFCFTEASCSSPDITSLIGELLPLCSSSERRKFENIGNMLNTIEQMKNMMEMMEMMKDMFPEGEGGFNPDMLAGMMGMDGFDFSNMFQGS